MLLNLLLLALVRLLPELSKRHLRADSEAVTLSEDVLACPEAAAAEAAALVALVLASAALLAASLALVVAIPACTVTADIVESSVESLAPPVPR